MICVYKGSRLVGVSYTCGKQQINCSETLKINTQRLFNTVISTLLIVYGVLRGWYQVFAPQ